MNNDHEMPTNLGHLIDQARQLDDEIDANLDKIAFLRSQLTALRRAKSSTRADK